MKWLINRLRSRAAVLAHDLALIPVAWFGAYWLRFNLDAIPEPILAQAVRLLPIVLVLQGAMFWYFGLYRGVWRFASLPDLVRIIKAVIVGVAATATVLFLITRLENIPRSVFVLDAIILMLLLGGPRFLYRWIKDQHLYTGAGKRTLIVGAGDAGEMLTRDLLRDRTYAWQPVAFVDDHPRKQGKDIHGIPVAGTCDEITSVVSDFQVELILIALPSANARAIRRIVEICESTGVPFRTLPPLKELMSGQVGIKELRDVKIDDLLGREVVALDWDAITSGIAGRSVLISGGGGSIGSELSRQVARLRPRRLILIDHGEFNLYAIDLELRRTLPDLDLVCVLGDIADEVLVDGVLREHRPEVIFHAAAYKHVPMLEDQVRAAVLNNVIGTRTLATLADRHACDAFVMISTDKAVNPSNTMGATKRVAEILCQSLNASSKTRFITVRFGNVLGSAGSVIPLFQKQIADGGPVTVTHPDITRYFMTIPEAAQLIMQAGVIGQGGEIFVLDMGEPVKISYLAEQLILLSGKKPGENIEIVYTGLRPGEKLYEELFHDAEKLVDTVHPKILLAQSRRVDDALLQPAIADIEAASRSNDLPALKQAMQRLVPERIPTDGRRSASGAPSGAIV